jgi:hypothetical protein
MEGARHRDAAPHTSGQATTASPRRRAPTALRRPLRAQRRSRGQAPSAGRLTPSRSRRLCVPATNARASTPRKPGSGRRHAEMRRRARRPFLSTPTTADQRSSPPSDRPLRRQPSQIRPGESRICAPVLPPGPWSAGHFHVPPPPEDEAGDQRSPAAVTRASAGSRPAPPAAAGRWRSEARGLAARGVLRRLSRPARGRRGGCIFYYMISIKFSCPLTMLLLPAGKASSATLRMAARRYPSRLR